MLGGRLTTTAIDHCNLHLISYNNTGGSSRGEKGEHCLDVKIEIRDVEGIKHDLSDSLTVSFGIQ